jgi:hypothetical protein
MPLWTFFQQDCAVQECLLLVWFVLIEHWNIMYRPVSDASFTPSQQLLKSLMLMRRRRKTTQNRAPQ